MILIYESAANVSTELGQILVTSSLGITYENIVIQPRKNFNAWDRLLDKSLANGILPQAHYDAIKANEGEARIVHQLGTITIDKTELVDLINDYGIEVDTSGDSAAIIVNLNAINYQLLI